MHQKTIQSKPVTLDDTTGYQGYYDIVKLIECWYNFTTISKGMIWNCIEYFKLLCKAYQSVYKKYQ